MLDDYARSSLRSFSAAAFDEVLDEECGEGYHRCQVGQECIPEEWICNGIMNCRDGSDEDENLHDCEALKEDRRTDRSTIHGICKKPYIQCPGEQLCVVRCDGVRECTEEYGFDESREAMCNNTMCREFHGVTVETASLTSPSFPALYEANLDCSYTISASDKSQRIQVTFTEIDLEGQPGSCLDYVEIFDGNSTQSPRLKISNFKKYCGTKVPGSRTSSGPYLTLRLRTDDLLNRRGFNMTYLIAPKSSPRPSETQTSQLRKQRDTWESDTNFAAELFPTNEDHDHDYEYDYDSENDHHSDQDYDYDQDYSHDDIYEEDNSQDIQNSSTDVVDEYEPPQSRTKKIFQVQDDNFFGLYKNSQLPDYFDFMQAAYFHQDVVQSNGHQGKDFIVQCSYDSRKCDWNDFTTFQDSLYGNCFSFNSIRNKIMNGTMPKLRTSSKTGHESGLKVTLFLDIQEYIGLFAQNYNARVLIHDPEIAPEMKSEGFPVPAGQATFIAARKNAVDRKGGKYDNCSSTWPEFLKFTEDFKNKWPRYSQERCLKFCIENELARRCNCTDGYDTQFSLDEKVNSGTAYYCKLTNRTQSRCREEVYLELRNGGANCPCPQACLTVDFRLQTSSAPWPTQSYALFCLQNAEISIETSHQIHDRNYKVK